MEFRVRITIETNVLFSDGINATIEDAIDNALGCGLSELIDAGEYALVSTEGTQL
jgi:hypothetical protein